MYNKNIFRKANDKKLLHKVGKQWITVSIAMLMLIGGGAVVSHTTHAATDTPKTTSVANQSTQETDNQLKRDNSSAIQSSASNLHKALLNNSVKSNTNPSNNAPIHQTAKPNSAYANYLKQMGGQSAYNNLMNNEAKIHNNKVNVKSYIELDSKLNQQLVPYGNDTDWITIVDPNTSQVKGFISSNDVTDWKNHTGSSDMFGLNWRYSPKYNALEFLSGSLTNLTDRWGDSEFSYAIQQKQLQPTSIKFDKGIRNNKNITTLQGMYNELSYIHSIDMIGLDGSNLNTINQPFDELTLYNLVWPSNFNERVIPRQYDEKSDTWIPANNIVLSFTQNNTISMTFPTKFNFNSDTKDKNGDPDTDFISYLKQYKWAENGEIVNLFDNKPYIGELVAVPNNSPYINIDYKNGNKLIGSKTLVWPNVNRLNCNDNINVHIPNGYHRIYNTQYNYDNETHNVQIAPANVTDTITYNLSTANTPNNYKGNTGNISNQHLTGPENIKISDNKFTIPKGFHAINTPNITYDNQQHTIEVAPNSENVNVTYIDQNGKTYKGSINGQYNQKINDVTTRYNLPKGYHVNDGQDKSYTFNSNQNQTDKIHITGNTQAKNIEITINKYNYKGSKLLNSTNKNYAISGQIGNKIPINPSTYTPTNYRTISNTYNDLMTVNGYQNNHITFNYNSLSSNITVNYVSFKTGNIIQKVGSKTADAGTPFNVYQYINKIPHGYEYAGVQLAKSDPDNNFDGTSFDDDNHTINILLNRVKPASVASSTITVNCINNSTHQVVKKVGSITEKITTPFDISKYLSDIPKGYEYAGIKNDVDSFDYNNHTVDILVNKVNPAPVAQSTITVNYINKATNQAVAPSKSDTKDVSTPFDIGEYLSNIPSGYQYAGIHAINPDSDFNGTEFDYKNQNIDILLNKVTPAKVAKSTITVNYINNGNVINSIKETKPVSTDFNIDDYLENIPSGYEYAGLKNLTDHFKYDDQSVNMLLTKVPQPNIARSTITVNYINKATGQKVANSKSDTEDVSTPFDIGTYLSNLPSDYQYNATQMINPDSDFNGTEFDYRNQTINVFLTKEPSSTITVNYINKTNHNKVTSIKPLSNQVGTPFDINPYLSNIPVGYEYAGINGSTNYFESNNQTINILLTKIPNAKIARSTITVNDVNAKSGKTIKKVGSDTENITTPFDIDPYLSNLPQGYEYAGIKGDVDSFDYDNHTVDVLLNKIHNPKVAQSTITINYINKDTGKDIPNVHPIKVTNNVSTNFNATDYLSNLPQGYEYAGLKNSTDHFKYNNQTVDILLIKAPNTKVAQSTITVNYINKANNKLISKAGSDTEDITTPFDINQYLNNLPESYEYAGIKGDIDSFDYNNHTVNVLLNKVHTPKVAQSTITINYTNNGKIVTSIKDTKPISTNFDIDQYLSKLPSNYEYAGIKNDVDHFDYNPHTVDIILTKVPNAKVAQSTITVNYINKANDKLISKAGSDTEKITTPFDISQYLSDLPQGYEYSGIKGNVNSFDYNNHTINVLLNPVHEPKVARSTITVNYIDKDNNKIIKSIPTTNNVSTNFNIDNYLNKLPQGYKYVNVSGKVNHFDYNSHDVDILLTKVSSAKPKSANSAPSNASTKASGTNSTVSSATSNQNTSSSASTKSSKATSFAKSGNSSQSNANSATSADNTQSTTNSTFNSNASASSMNSKADSKSTINSSSTKSSASSATSFSSSTSIISSSNSVSSIVISTPIFSSISSTNTVSTSPTLTSSKGINHYMSKPTSIVHNDVVNISNLNDLHVGKSAKRHGYIITRLNILKHYNYFCIIKSCLAHKHPTSIGKTIDYIKVMHPKYHYTFHIEKIFKLRKNNKITYAYEFRAKFGKHYHNYFVTGNKHFTSNSYWQKHNLKSDKLIKIICDAWEHTSKRYTKANRIRMWRRGTVMPIYKLKKISSGGITRFQLRNGHWITANKNFVKII